MFSSPKMSGLHTVFSPCRHNSSNVLHRPSGVMVLRPPHRVHQTKNGNTVHNGFYVIFVSKYAQESYRHLLLHDQFLNEMLQRSKCFYLVKLGKSHSIAFQMSKSKVPWLSCCQMPSKYLCSWLQTQATLNLSSRSLFMMSSSCAQVDQSKWQE